MNEKLISIAILCIGMAIFIMSVCNAIYMLHTAPKVFNRLELQIETIRKQLDWNTECIDAVGLRTAREAE